MNTGKCEQTVYGRHPRHGQRGFSLLEVLVTLIVLAIGLLGLAGLQAYGLQNNHGAYTRSQVSLMSYEIVDSMRANRSDALAGDYDINLGDGDPAGNTQPAIDVREWRQDLRNRLPDGRGAISVGADNVVEITIDWDESRIRAREENIDPDDVQRTSIVTRTRL